MIPTVLRILRWLYFVAVLVGASVALAIGTPLQDVLVRLVFYIALPLNWYVAYRLWRLSRSAPEVAVLHERAVVATALAGIVTVFALVFANNGMAVPILDLAGTQIVTRTAILSLSIPALYWLFLYRNGRRD